MSAEGLRQAFSNLEQQMLDDIASFGRWFNRTLERTQLNSLSAQELKDLLNVIDKKRNELLLKWEENIQTDPKLHLILTTVSAQKGVEYKRHEAFDLMARVYRRRLRFRLRVFCYVHYILLQHFLNRHGLSSKIYCKKTAGKISINVNTTLAQMQHYMSWVLLRERNISVFKEFTSLVKDVYSRLPSYFTDDELGRLLHNVKAGIIGAAAARKIFEIQNTIPKDSKAPTAKFKVVAPDPNLDAKYAIDWIVVHKENFYRKIAHFLDLRAHQKLPKNQETPLRHLLERAGTQEWIRALNYFSSIYEIDFSDTIFALQVKTSANTSELLNIGAPIARGYKSRIVIGNYKHNHNLHVLRNIKADFARMRKGLKHATPVFIHMDYQEAQCIIKC